MAEATSGTSVRNTQHCPTLIFELGLPVFYRFAKSVMEPALLFFVVCARVCVCVCFFFAVSRQNSRVPTFNSRMIIHPCTKDSLEIIENMNVK